MGKNHFHAGFALVEAAMTPPNSSAVSPVDWASKKIFTTGEAAAVCKVSQPTIIRCFDSGRLTGFRVRTPRSCSSAAS